MIKHLSQHLTKTPSNVRTFFELPSRVALKNDLFRKRPLLNSILSSLLTLFVRIFSMGKVESEINTHNKNIKGIEQYNMGFRTSCLGYISYSCSTVHGPI